MGQGTKADVLIVGAGPTGLLMAYLLTLQKISFKIIDKNLEPAGHSRALLLQPRTLEMFHNLGIVDRFLDKGFKIQGIDFFSEGKKLGSLVFSELPSEYNFGLIIPQTETEQILTACIKENSREICRGEELIGLSFEEQNVAAKIKLTDGKIVTENFGWVIGADGMHSTTRTLLGISFTGKEQPEVFGLSDVIASTALAKDKVTIYLTKKGVFGSIPMKDDKYRIIVDNCSYEADKKSLSKEELEKITQERCPVAIEYKEILWSSVFYIHYKKAETFYKDRTFLLGDAAHIHSPVGGQGMNTGLQDAMNLAWKLGQYIDGASHKDLLLSYAEERESIISKLLSYTSFLTKIFVTQKAFFIFLRDKLLFFMLSAKKSRKALAMNISELGICYKKSSIIREDRGTPFTKGYLFFGDGPDVGSRAPYCQLLLKAAEKKLIHKLYIYFPSSEAQKVETTFQLHKIEKWMAIYLSEQVQLILITEAESTIAAIGWKHQALIDKERSFATAYHVKAPCIYAIRPDSYIGFRAHGLRYFSLRKYFSRVFDIH